MRVSGGRASQAGVTASAKTLSWECAGVARSKEASVAGKG